MDETTGTGTAVQESLEHTASENPPARTRGGDDALVMPLIPLALCSSATAR